MDDDIRQKLTEIDNKLDSLTASVRRALDALSAVHSSNGNGVIGRIDDLNARVTVLEETAGGAREN